MSFARIVGAAIVLSLVAVGGDRVHTQQPAAAQPFQFHLLEATIADVHRGIQEGQLTCRALVQAYINRARAYNGTCNQLVTEDMAPKFLPDYAEYAAAAAATARAAAGRSAKDAADRIRTDGADRVRSRRPAAVRDDGRHPERRPGARARNAQHPRGAIGHLQRRLRSASVGRAAAGGSAGGLRAVSPAARCARARRGTGRAVRSKSRPSERCRCTASRSRSRTRMK